MLVVLPIKRLPPQKEAIILKIPFRLASYGPANDCIVLKKSLFNP